MKRLSAIALMLVACIYAVQARQFALHSALDDFMKQKKVQSICTVSKDCDPASDPASRPKKWKIINYRFSTTDKGCVSKFDNLARAYNSDINNENTVSAYQLDGTDLAFSVEYSDYQKPIAIGCYDDLTHVMILSGSESPEVNTVLAVVWHDIPGGIEGYAYIVERDVALVKLKGDEASRAESENIRRLRFYADKLREQSGLYKPCLTIVMAASYVADDIRRNGTPQEKAQAARLIDEMISTESHLYKIEDNKVDLVEANRKLLEMARWFADDNKAALEGNSGEFNLVGHIDKELWDIGYYISLGDDEMYIDQSKSDFVLADNLAFDYHTQLSDIRLGRVRALFKDGTVCSAYIELPFVPGETLELFVHNGYYSLSGTGFYQQWKNAIYARSPKQYALDHLDQPGALCAIFKEGRLSAADLNEIYAQIPPAIKSSPYGVYLRKFLK